MSRLIARPRCAVTFSSAVAELLKVYQLAAADDHFRLQTSLVTVSCCGVWELIDENTGSFQASTQTPKSLQRWPCDSVWISFIVASSCCTQAVLCLFIEIRMGRHPSHVSVWWTRSFSRQTAHFTQRKDRNRGNSTNVGCLLGNQLQELSGNCTSQNKSGLTKPWK